MTVKPPPVTAPETVSVARQVLVHLVLPTAGLALFGYSAALMAWAVTTPGAAV